MKLGLIINHQAARCNDGIRWKVQAKLNGHLRSIKETAWPGQATCLAREMASRELDAIVVAGGDGTVNEALNGIMGSGKALGIIPCGTANDLAGYLGIPTDPAAACDVVLSGHSRSIDLVKVNSWYFATTGGIGVPSEVIRLTDWIRNRLAGRWIAARLGNKLYVMALVIAGLRHRRGPGRVEINCDAETWSSTVFSLTLSNVPRLAGHFHLAPEAAAEDGSTHLCCIQNTRRLIPLMRSVALTMSGTHSSCDNVKLSRERRVSISCGRPTAFFGDGNIKEINDHFHLEVAPAALPVLVPESERGSSYEH